jgi:hypothetical protein
VKMPEIMPLRWLVANNTLSPILFSQITACIEKFLLVRNAAVYIKYPSQYYVSTTKPTKTINIIPTYQ